MCIHYVYSLCVFIMCIHYVYSLCVFIMRSLCCGWGAAPVGLSNEVQRRWGTHPPAQPPLVYRTKFGGVGGRTPRRSPRWSIERSSAALGTHPPAHPPSIRQSIYQLIPKQQRSDHFTLTYFIFLVMGLNCSVFILSLNGRINTRN